ncbi:MAG: c-type cytochrome biogenesis protein CcmF, partial [Gammaproteobacteria bacterium]|nr:c-type cytochrome biogenesis protein CcmF [Gammaproteobacteria bacterium]
LLVCAAGGILLGTIYPLLLDGLDMGKISVGPPYFEAVFLIPMLPLVFLIGVGMHSFWRHMQGEVLYRRLRLAAIAAVLLTAAALLTGIADMSPLTVLGVLAGLWIITSVIAEPLQALREGGLRNLSRARWGMLVAHLGVGLFTLGVTVTKDQGIEVDRSVKPGEIIELADYSIEFIGLRNVAGPNYKAVEGTFQVSRDGRAVAELKPQKRVYNVQRSPMTEASIDAGWRRDIFVALGESLGADAWSVRAQYKPMIRFIWFGCLVMAVGGLLAASDRRYKHAREHAQTAPAGAAPGAPA